MKYAKKKREMVEICTQHVWNMQKYAKWNLVSPQNFMNREDVLNMRFKAQVFVFSLSKLPLPWVGTSELFVSSVLMQFYVGIDLRRIWHKAYHFPVLYHQPQNSALATPLNTKSFKVPVSCGMDMGNSPDWQFRSFWIRHLYWFLELLY